jgi:hypothetical protein
MSARIWGLVAVLALVGAGLLVRRVVADTPVAPGETHLAINAVNATSGVASVATVTGRRVSVKAASVSSTVAGVLLFRDGSSSGTVLGRMPLPVADTLYHLTSDMLGPGMTTTAGNSLFLEFTAGSSISGGLRYRVER